MVKISSEEYYDKFALKYDDAINDSQFNVKYISEAVKIFHKYNHDQGSILDLACGTGLLSELLQGNFEYTGIDISSKMLEFAQERGYKTIHKSIETALEKIDSNSYDFVFCLSALLFIKNANTAIENMKRIARKSLLITIDEVTDKYTKNIPISVYNHSQISIVNALEDYFIIGWTAINLDILMNTRMIYIET